MITFAVLGELTVHRDGGPVAVQAALLRRLLAVLACRSGTAVSASTLADEIWDGSPPVSARKTLQVYVHRLRQALGEPTRIQHGGDGYRLVVDREELDSLQFIDLLAQARVAGREARLSRASELYRQALDLWRGDPYADVPAGPLLEAEVRVLAAQRFQARQECIAVGLDLGQHVEHAAELAQLTEIYPFHEGLRGLLMLALCRCGRRAEALEVFRTTRALLVNQLGVEPDRPMQRLHQAILDGDPCLGHIKVEDLRHIGTPGSPLHLTQAKAPAQLPGDTAGFVGRTAELALLDALVKRTSNALTGVVIAGITGTAGIGKTTLALHWAHRVAHRFPDGQLYVNLRGFDDLGHPVNPAEAINGFLEAFAVPAEQIPASLPAIAALYRSTLAGRRVLVVLDNALDAEQVRPLLPGTPDSLVLVTSRNQLAGLVAAEGARPVSLDLLSETEARDMLAYRLGTNRVAEEPAAVSRIISCCTGLPLALAIVAARSSTNPGLPLAALAAELNGDEARLDALTGDGPGSDVRSVFSWSYRKLSVNAARLFRLLACHPGRGFGVDAAASLAGVSARHAKRLLSELTRAHLVWEQTAGRYAFHDLLRAYAGELVESRNYEEDRRAALGRVFDYYLHTSHAADRQLYPHRHPIALVSPSPGSATTELGDVEHALVWFSTERSALVSAIKQAADSEFYTHAWQIAWSVHTFFERRGHSHELDAIDQIALEATERLDDQVAEATVRLILGTTNTVADRFEQAHHHYSRMFELLRKHGNDNALLAHGHLNRSVTFGHEGLYEHALEQAHLSLDLFRALDHRPGVAKSLNAVGWFQIQLGQAESALASCRRAIVIARAVGDRQGQALSWDSLGYAHHCLGNHCEAETCYRRSIDLWRMLGRRHQQISVLHRLGDTHLATGDGKAAWRAWREAIDIADDLSHPETDKIRAKLHGVVHA